MCGSLRHSHWATRSPMKLGDSFPEGATVVVTGHAADKPIWNGHSRIEELSKWKSKGWEEGHMEVETFTEEGIEFRVPPEKAIKIIGFKKPTGCYINIVTRAATDDPSMDSTSGPTNLTEKQVHSRWPVFVDREDPH